MSPVDRDPSSGLNGAVAAVLRAERAADNERITQDDLAEAAGVPTVSLRRYLNGKRHIDVAVLYAICEAMGLDPQWVISQATLRLTGRPLIAASIDPSEPARGRSDLSFISMTDEVVAAEPVEDVTPAAARRPGRRGSKSDQGEA